MRNTFRMDFSFLPVIFLFSFTFLHKRKLQKVCKIWISTNFYITRMYYKKLKKELTLWVAIQIALDNDYSLSYFCLNEVYLVNLPKYCGKLKKVMREILNLKVTVETTSSV